MGRRCERLEPTQHPVQSGKFLVHPLAQAHADARQRLSTTDDAVGVRAENEKPPNDRGFNDKSELLTIADHQRQAERGGFEPPVGLKPYTDLANRRIRPLCHLSDPRADGRKYSGQTSERNVAGTSSECLIRVVWGSIPTAIFVRAVVMTSIESNDSAVSPCSTTSACENYFNREGCLGPNSV